MNGTSERGFALATVLWGIAVLSLIAGVMIVSSLNAARIDRNAWLQLQVRSAADEGVQMTILSLFDPDAHNRPPLDGTERQSAVGDIALTLSVQDESGRIDLNAATRGELTSLLQTAGADDPHTLAGHIIDWRSANTDIDGASVDDYAHAGSDYRPRGGPFQSVEELRQVLGMTPELFKRIEPALTVYSHSPNFDMRYAPKEVLETIPGMTDINAQATIDARTQKPTASGPATVIPGLALPGMDTVMASPPLTGHSFSITVSATKGRTYFQRHAVVLLTGDPARPYLILDWR